MTPQLYLSQKDLPMPEVKGFTHCRAYGCAKRDRVTLTEQDWQDINVLFDNAKNNAADERAAISQAIGMFERKVGAITGTSADKAGTYVKWGLYQHDCVDESLNTTTYLMLLDQQGLLKFHTVDAPSARLFFTSGHPGPHQTATITDKNTGERFAVDSWFHDNGAPAEVVNFEEWLYGWRPKI